MLARWVLFPRYLLRPSPDAGRGIPGLDRVHISAEGGSVEGWVLPGDGASRDRPGPLVVFAHGNGELIDDWPELLEPYRRMGASVLLPEYRGYGRSAGSPSEEAIVGDFVQFVDRAVTRPEVDSERLV